jgi:predicted DNA-binding protein (UPF0251 family)
MTVGSLAVIKPEPEQKCCYCRHIYKCRSRRTTHGKPLSDRNDTINLLVCRVKIGITKNRATTTLLQLFRPGMVNLVASAKRRAGSTHIDFDEMLTEMQSFAVESIIVKYRIGELNPITNFLFDKRNGYLIKWTRWYITKHKRFNARHQLAGSHPTDSGEEFDFIDGGGDENYEGGTNNAASSNYFTEIALDTHYANERHSLADEVLDIIEDGLTLNANEYRALRFCLHNANDSNDIRMIDGLHIHLARMMGVSRPRVTRLYKRGKDKIVVAIQKRRYEIQEEETRNEADPVYAV